MARQLPHRRRPRPAGAGRPSCPAVFLHRLPVTYSDGGGCVSLTSLVLLSVSSSDSSREAPSMCSWRRPDRLEEKLIGPPRLVRIGRRHVGKHVKNMWQSNFHPFLRHTTRGCEWHDHDRLWAFPLSCRRARLPCWQHTACAEQVSVPEPVWLAVLGAVRP